MEDVGFDKSNRSGSFLKGLLKSTALALLVTFVMLVLAALLLCFTDFPENYTYPAAIAATVIGILAGSFQAARKNPSNKLFASMVTALVYTVIAYIIGSIVQGQFCLNIRTLIYLAVALLTGAIGSMLASRAREDTKKYKGSSYIADKFNSKTTKKSYKFGKPGN